jgi:methionyl-tRNA formyltransferase
MKHIIARSKVWGGTQLIDALSKRSDNEFILVNHKSALTTNYLSEIEPRYVFFPHWSHVIPPELYENHECVIFHMTDLPFGRGGSPLQNLISRGIYETQISALRCVKELDAGPIYFKRPLSLHGTAQEIFMRANVIIEDMIIALIENNPSPQKQSGEPVVFKRRNENDGNIDKLETIEKVHDYIRMLDADGYPSAFFETENLRFEFSRSSIREGFVLADVVIKRRSKNK